MSHTHDDFDVTTATDKQLAGRAFFLALMSIDAKTQGRVNDYVEAVFPATVAEINRRKDYGRS